MKWGRDSRGTELLRKSCKSHLEFRLLLVITPPSARGQHFIYPNWKFRNFCSSDEDMSVVGSSSPLWNDFVSKKYQLGGGSFLCCSISTGDGSLKIGINFPDERNSGSGLRTQSMDRFLEWGSSPGPPRPPSKLFLLQSPLQTRGGRSAGKWCSGPCDR